MARRQANLASAILKDKDVVSLSSFIGVDGSNITLNSGRMLVNLKPVDDRSDTASDIIHRLQRETSDISGISLYMQPVQDLSIDDTVSRTQYQFVLEDANPTEFNTWVPKLVDRLQQVKEIEDVASDQENQGLSAYLTIDRDTAGRFGITPATVDNALYDAFGQRIVSTIFTQSNQYRVILQADSSLMASLDSLGTLYLPSATAVGGQVPLSALVKVETRTAPLSIDHLGQFPSTTVSFNLAPRAALGDAVDAIRKAEADIHMPESLMTTFEGAALAFESTLSNEVFLIIAAIVTVYIVLGVLYESFIHPITILSTLPSAGVGALLALLVAGSDLGVIGIIGIILLIGIVKKNAIMMIDFALVAERQQGMSPRDAIYHASLLRFRPILMTTMAALLGALPLMLGTGTGSELRHPLGITIVGGLIFRQLLTLYTTPVIYLYFDRLERRVAAWGADPTARHAPPSGPRIRMIPSEPFIRRPVATTLLTLGIALAGGIAYFKLPVSPLPQVDFPTISVSASMAGASPDVMAATVATPLERHLGQIADVTELTSQSATGSSRVTLQFGLDRSIDGAARDVEAGINAARADLPTALRSNPTYRKVNPADAPVMILALSSKTLTPGQLYDSADTILSQKLSQVAGIGQVQIGGSSLPAVRIELNPSALFKYGIGLEDVRAALSAANAHTPKGSIDVGGRRYQLYTNDQASKANEYRSMVIAYRNGSSRGAPRRCGRCERWGRERP